MLHVLEMYAHVRQGIYYLNTPVQEMVEYEGINHKRLFAICRSPLDDRHSPYCSTFAVSPYQLARISPIKFSFDTDMILEWAVKDAVQGSTYIK